MTDEKRIEEIRRKWSESYGPLMEDVGFLLAAYDAERARANRAEETLRTETARMSITLSKCVFTTELEAARAEIARLQELVNCDCDSEMRKALDVQTFGRAADLGKTIALEREVAKLRKAMPSASLCEAMSDWLDRIEKARE